MGFSEPMTAVKTGSGSIRIVISGSAPYREVLLRTLHPGFICRLVWITLLGILQQPFQQTKEVPTP